MYICYDHVTKNKENIWIVNFTLSLCIYHKDIESCSFSSLISYLVFQLKSTLMAQVVMLSLSGIFRPHMCKHSQISRTAQLLECNWKKIKECCNWFVRTILNMFSNIGRILNFETILKIWEYMDCSYKPVKYSQFISFLKDEQFSILLNVYISGTRWILGV